MAILRGQITTHWIGTGDTGDGDPVNEDPNRPLAPQDHPHRFNPDGTVLTEGIRKWGDVTAQPGASLHPDPDTYEIVAEFDDTVLASLQADTALWLQWYEEVV